MSRRTLAVVLAENQYENLELHYPRLRLQEAGWRVQVVGPKAGTSYASKEGYPAVADASFRDVAPADVGVLVVPGGYAPDKLRRDPDCLRLVAQAHERGAVIAFICHGGWVPISSKIVKGRKVTSVPAIRDDLENAGAQWVDEPCVVDGRMVTAQLPKDLPAFLAAILEAAG